MLTLTEQKMMVIQTMYLIDTNIISEMRKQRQANLGVQAFFAEAMNNSEEIFLSVITIGELRRGTEKIKHRGDVKQAQALDTWLDTITHEYAEHLLPFTNVEAQIWGRLRVPHHENAIDKQIAATALVYDLVLVTRNIKDFSHTGVKTLNPFTSS